MQAKWTYAAQHHLVSYTTRIGPFRVVVHQDVASETITGYRPWKMSVFAGAGTVAPFAGIALDSPLKADAQREALNKLREELSKTLQLVADALVP